MISMKILLIVDQYDSANNGTTITARRFAKTLESHGHEVRVVSCGKPAPHKYKLPALHFGPIVETIIRSQGMQFAVPRSKILKKALAWADVAHFLMPFWLQQKALRIAEEMNVPHTAAFHVQPENITSTIFLGNCAPVNEFLYRYFRDHFYDRFTHIHCPSAFIAGELHKRGYKGKTHVISNGIEPGFCYHKLPKAPEFEGKILIVMIGRLSREKRQDVLIDAVAQSKYADRIQLVLAGKGPHKGALLRRAKKLNNPLITGFYPGTALKNLLAMCDLYVHASDAEIEAISCIEAFASGLVPVIADSKKSATPQFALDRRSLFAAGDSTDLAAKIDYWLDNEEEKKRMEYVYAEHAQKYAIDRCVEKAEEMFCAAIEENGVSHA